MIYPKKWCQGLLRSWDALGQLQPWAATIVFVLAYTLLQFRYIDLPPYWDGTVNFASAFAIQDNHLIPLLSKADTGHPPLLAWMLAVLGRLGIPMIAGFHLITWVFTGVLLGATWRLGRRLGGETVGWFSAALVGLNPCVVGQALQFNLDIPMAAFGVLAMALFAEGRYWSAGVSAALLCLTKLNGLLGLLPFGAMALWLVAFDSRFRCPRMLLRLAWVCCFPLVVFTAYLGIKQLVLGRVFDSGEFEAGRQVALAANFKEYYGLTLHSLYQMLANNGMWYFFCAVPMAALLRWSCKCWGKALVTFHQSPFAAADKSGKIPGEDRHERPSRNGEATDRVAAGKQVTSDRPGLSNVRIFGLLAMMVLFEVLGQSIRAIGTIPRYFIITYPSLVLPVVWGVWASFPAPRRIVALSLVVLVLGGIQVIKWHPKYWIRWHATVQQLVSNPSVETPSNQEWSMGFVDVLRQTETIARKLDRRIKPGQRIGGDWPFITYLTDPRFGLVEEPHEWADPGFPNWWENRGKVDFIVIHDWHPFHEPLPYGYPGAKGLELIKSRTGPTGSLALYQFHPEQTE